MLNIIIPVVFYFRNALAEKGFFNAYQNSMALMHAINIVILTFTNRELIITLGRIKPFDVKREG